MRFLLILFVYISFSFSQDYVLICISGTAYAYHKITCRGLKECTHTIEKVSQAEAIKQRRKPCGYCYKTSSAPVSNDDDSPGQCRGITKKGSRCSRTVREGSYCYQHGG
jgi:hypothetical protein